MTTRGFFSILEHGPCRRSHHFCFACAYNATCNVCDVQPAHHKKRPSEIYRCLSAWCWWISLWFVSEEITSSSCLHSKWLFSSNPLSVMTCLSSSNLRKPKDYYPKITARGLLVRLIQCSWHQRDLQRDAQIPPVRSVCQLQRSVRSSALKAFKEENDSNNLTLGPSWGDSITKEWPAIERLADIFAVTRFIWNAFSLAARKMPSPSHKSACVQTFVLMYCSACFRHS